MLKHFPEKSQKICQLCEQNPLSFPADGKGSGLGDHGCRQYFFDNRGGCCSIWQ
jgi:hypothetical protein